MVRRCFVGALLAVFAWPVANAYADVITYTVDPTRSSLMISGTYQGYSLQSQSDNSNGLTAWYTGSITAIRDFNTGTLQITSSAITAQTSGSSYLPPGSLSGDYGFATPSFGTGLDREFDWGTIFDFGFSVTSQAMRAPSNSFDVTQLEASVSSGEIEYGYFIGRLVAAYSASMDGPLALGPGTGTLVDSGGVETLTLPISISYIVSLPGVQNSSYNLNAQLSGVIVAVAPVPEPATIAVLGIPALFLLKGRNS